MCVYLLQDIDELITRKRKALKNPEAFFESLMNGVCTQQVSTNKYTDSISHVIHYRQDKRWPLYQILI